MIKVHISEALQFSGPRPTRIMLSQMLRHFEAIAPLGVCLILLIGAFPYAPWWTALWGGLYLGYALLKNWLRERTGVRFYYSERVQVVRTLLMLISITVFLAYLYPQVPYEAKDAGPDSLWLLYLLVALVVGLHGSLRSMIVVGFWTIIAGPIVEYSFLTRSPSPVAWFPYIPLAVLSKGVWIFVIVVLLTVFVRFLRDQMLNLGLLHHVEEEISKTVDEDKQLQATVDAVAESFSYPHVNIFVVRDDNTLECVAGAGEHGRQLMGKRFAVSEPRSMVVHAASHRNTFAANDVSKTADETYPDGYYLYSDEFPRTQSEVSVPIIVNGRVYGVLDVQTHHKDYFMPHDINVLEVVAHHVGRSLSKIHMVELSKRTAKNLLSQEELSLRLRLALEDAQKLLRAHSIILFERDPVNSKILPIAYAGTLKHPDKLNWSEAERGTLVYRLFEQATRRRGPFYHMSVSRSVVEDPLFANADYHRKNQTKTFCQRDGIVSRAVVLLFDEDRCTGLIWINFDAQQYFDNAQREAIESFTSLAEAALRKDQELRRQMSSQRMALEREREDMRRRHATDLHDHVKNGVAAAQQIICTLVREGNLNKRQLKGLRSALDNLNDVFKDTEIMIAVALGELREVQIDLRHEIEKLKNTFYLWYDMRVTDEWVGDPRRIPKILRWHLKGAIKEAVSNTANHSDADKVKMKIQITDERVYVTIEDNGTVCDPEVVAASNRGVANLKSRMSELHGLAEMEITEAGGVLVLLEAPLAT